MVFSNKGIKLLFAFTIQSLALFGQTELYFNTPDAGNKIYTASNKISFLPGYTYTATSSQSLKAYISDQVFTPATNYFSPFTSSTLPNSSTAFPGFDYTLPVGVMAGTAGVNLSGAATYQIPVKVAPGTNNMVPEINLTYNSFNGNGLVGYGWSLEGTSAITRVNSDLYHDMDVKPVKLTSSDNYMIDGLRMIPTTGGIFTEQETFSHITVPATGTNGPAWFKVELKNGITMEYGNTSDSKVMAADGTVISWLINKSYDAYGNYIQYIYETVENNVCLTKILYTGNSNTGLLPYNEISFTYSKRSDKNDSYVLGNKTSLNYLLSSIQVKSESEVVRSYSFVYSYNKYSYLNEVYEYGADFSHFNSTKFLYGTNDVTPQINDVSATFPTNAEYRTGDYNGDGLEDFTCFVFNYSSGVKNFLYYQLWINDGDGTYTLLLDNQPLPSLFFDEDKENPYVVYKTKTRKIHTDPYKDDQGHLKGTVTLTGADIHQRVLHGAFGGENANANFAGGMQSFDINGDGFDDLLLGTLTSGGYSYIPYLFNGTSFVAQTDKALNVTTVHKFSVGDYDGDRFLDAFTFNVSTQVWQVHFFKTGETISGSGFSSTTSPIVTIASPYFYPMDFDGDGTTELLLQSGSESVVMDVFVQPSYTIVSGEIVPISPLVALNELFRSSFPNPMAQLYFLDFNGDGKTDVYQHNASNGLGQIGLSTASNFDLRTMNTSKDGIYDIAGLLIDDLDADGKSDIIQLNRDTGTTLSYALHSVTIFKSNGIGMNSQIISCGDISITDDQNPEFDFIVDTDLGTPSLFIKNGIQTSNYKLSLYNSAQQYLLHSVSNSYGIVSSYEYENITKTGGVYQKGTGSVSPVIDFKKPFHVVSSFSVPDGAGGTNTTDYKYYNAKMHHQGKGFLGFEKIVSENTTFDIKTTNEFSLNEQFYFFVPVSKTIALLSTGDILSVNEETYNIIDKTVGPGTLAPRKAFLALSASSTNHDYVKGFTNTVNTTYDSYGNVVSRNTDYDGAYSTNISVDAFSAAGTYYPSKPHLVTTTNTITGKPANTRTQEFFYNTQGSPINIETNNIQYTNSFDAYGNLTSQEILPSGMTSRYNTFTYDPNGRFVVDKTNNLSRNIHTIYDNRWGVPISMTGIDGQVSTYHYDGFGRLVKVISPTGAQATTDWEFVSDFSGGAFNAPVFFEHKQGTQTAYSKSYHDIMGRPVKNENREFTGIALTEQSYDARGNILETTGAHYDSDPGNITSYTYDNINRPLTVSSPTGTTNYSYSNSSGYKVTTTNGAGQSMANTYAAFDKVTSSEDDGGTMLFDYNSQLLVEQIKVGGVVVSQMTYDLNGNQLTLDELNKGLTTYEYNALGQIVEQTDANGNVYTTAYDQLDRPTIETGPEGTYTTNYVSSGNGIDRISSVAGPNGYTESYTYDAFARPLTYTENIGSEVLTQSFTYDIQNRPILVTYPSGYTVKNHYNADGVFFKVTDESESITFSELTETNAFGQSTKVMSGNGVEAEMTYDNFGRLIHKYAAGIQDLNFSWNNTTGCLLSRTDNIKGLTENFVYDITDRLTHVKDASMTDIQTMTYNANGNILTKSDAGDYTYDPSKKHAVTNVDNSVATTISTDLQEITYTAFNKAETITEGAYEYALSYGPDLERKKTVMANSSDHSQIYTRYYFNNYEKQVDATHTTEVHYIPGFDGPAAMYVVQDGTGNFFYPYTDHVGSINTVTDNTGTVVAEQSYDAWGRSRNPFTWDYTASSLTNPAWLWRGFTGHEMLPEFNLVNMNGRLYDPIVGRMLTPDSYAQGGTQGYNRYSYAQNNPLKYTDPEGEWIQYVVGAVAGGFAGYQLGKATGHDWGHGLLWYTLGGAAIGTVTGGLGAGIASADIAFANVTGVMVSSFTASIGFNLLTEGATGTNISIGVATFNFDTNEFGFLGKKGNTKLENWGYVFGSLAFIQDLVAWTHGTDVDVKSRPVLAGHSEFSGQYDGDQILVSVGPSGPDLAPDLGGLEWEKVYVKAQLDGHAAPGENVSYIKPDHPQFNTKVHNVNGKLLRKMTERLNSGRNLLDTGPLKYGLTKGCVNFTSRALLYSGVLNVNAFLPVTAPVLLNFELAVRQMGFYASPYFTINTR